MADDGESLLLKLKDLEEKVSGKYMRAALRAGAKVVRERMISDAPVMSGTTRDAVRLQAMKRKKNRTGVMVSVGEGFFKGKTFYAGFVEFGHRVGKRLKASVLRIRGDTRGEVPAKPWMHKAFNESIGGAEVAVHETLIKRLKDDEIKR